MTLRVTGKCARGGTSGTGMSGFFSRGHMLSWLHTVDMDDLPLDFGGAGGNGGMGIPGGEREMNGRSRSCSVDMSSSLPKMVGSDESLARMGWSSTCSTPSVVMGLTI